MLKLSCGAWLLSPHQPLLPYSALERVFWLQALLQAPSLLSPLQSRASSPAAAPPAQHLAAVSSFVFNKVAALSLISRRGVEAPRAGAALRAAARLLGGQG